MDSQQHNLTRSDSQRIPFNLDRLKKALVEARQLGFQVRREWLGGSAGGWCEMGGRRILFVDLSLTVDEQLEQVLGAIAAAERDQRAA